MKQSPAASRHTFITYHGLDLSLLVDLRCSQMQKLLEWAFWEENYLFQVLTGMGEYLPRKGL